jgi:hypothetical protein
VLARCIAATAALLLPVPSYAQITLEQVSDFAHRMCTTIPISSSNQQVTLTEEADSKLQSFLSSSSSAHITSEVTSGLLQKDLAEAIRDSNNCRSAIFATLITRVRIASGGQPVRDCTLGNVSLVMFERRSNLDAVALDHVLRNHGEQCFSIKEEPTALFINQPVNTIEFNDGGIDYRNVLKLIADLELSGISIDTITFPSAKVPRHTIWLDSTPYDKDGRAMIEQGRNLEWSRKMSPQEKERLRQIRSSNEFYALARSLKIDNPSAR